MRSWLFGLVICLSACAAENRTASDDSYTAQAEAIDATADDYAYASDDAADASYSYDGEAEVAANGNSGSATSSSVVLPSFRLPAPRPSARANLPRSLFGSPARVGDVSARMQAALEAAGYDDFSYYSVPAGFALITETERIRDDGSPYPGAARWVFASTPLVSIGALFDEGFPNGFLRRLRQVDPGRYRVLVFLVTTEAVTTSQAAAAFETAQVWTSGGGDYLPQSIARRPLAADHNISVLIYEFRRAAVASAPQFVNPSGLTARRHLQATRLLLAE